MRRISFQALPDSRMKGMDDMTGILQQFAAGNLLTQVPFFPPDSPYARASERAAELEEQLLHRLGEQEQKLFRRFEDAQGDLNQIAIDEAWVQGFRLGLTMTAEAFVGLDPLCAGGEGL